MISHVVYCSGIQAEAARGGREREVARGKRGGRRGCIYTTIYAQPTGKRATHVAAVVCGQKRKAQNIIVCP